MSDGNNAVELENPDDIPKYIKHGFYLWLNNLPKQAEQHFKCNIQNTSILAGYTFLLCVNGIISYEIDKIETAQYWLKELEKRCGLLNDGWLTTLRVKLFGNSMTNRIKSMHCNKKPLAKILEDQIILADTFMSSAILTFLTEDVTGLMKGSWLLRRAWKIYQNTYNQIYELYVEEFQNDVTVNFPATPFNYAKTIPRSMSDYTISTRRRTSFGTVASTPVNLSGNERCSSSSSSGGGGGVGFIGTSSSNSNKCKTTIPVQKTNNLNNENENSNDESELINRNNNSNNLNETIKTNAAANTTSTTTNALLFAKSPHSEKQYTNNKSEQFSTKISRLSPSSTKKLPSKSELNLNLENNKTISCKEFIEQQLPATCPTTASTNNDPLSLLMSTTRPSQLNVRPSIRLNNHHHQHHHHHHNNICNNNLIDKETIKRLMGAISFGYGIFLLTASLLPTKLLRIISIFGFEGNRDIGISCLTFSRESADTRSTISTISLLWYYTYGTQLFQFEDSNTTDEIYLATQLLNENENDYRKSAIFLFFRGRVERMKSNISQAVFYYEISYKNSAQIELKLLCLHEIAWCKLIQLDFASAMNRFNELRKTSIFSKAFYTYMTAICEAASGNFNNLITYRNAITEILTKSNQKNSQLGKFIEHRVKKFPLNCNAIKNDTPQEQQQYQYYWKYLVYEMLFLWSTMNSICSEDLEQIIFDCSVPDTDYFEPMIGVQKLILAGALVCLKNYQIAVNAYKECISKRECIIDDDAHVTAFAHYELAILLLRCSHDHKKDAKKLLQEALLIKNYDLENRLSVRIQKELKNIN